MFIYLFYFLFIYFYFFYLFFCIFPARFSSPLNLFSHAKKTSQIINSTHTYSILCINSKTYYYITPFNVNGGSPKGGGNYRPEHCLLSHHTCHFFFASFPLFSLVLLCSHSPNDVPHEPKWNVSIAAVWIRSAKVRVETSF